MNTVTMLPRRPRFTAKCGYDRSFEKPSFSYVINENKTGIVNGHPYKGVVVAKLYGGTGDLANIWNRRDKIGIQALEGVSTHLIRNVYGGPSYREFEGVAYCSVDDEWDMARGMKEARRKAWSQYYRCLEQYLIDYSTAIAGLSEQVERYYRFTAKRRHELDMQNTEIQKALGLAQEIV